MQLSGTPKTGVVAHFLLTLLVLRNLRFLAGTKVSMLKPVIAQMYIDKKVL